jgi:hypothetical protein
VNAEIQACFNHYIHDIGGTLLATKVDEDTEEVEKRARLIRKQTRLAKLLKKKVKVTDFEDGGLSVAIDREWDTSSWSDELILAGVDSLLLVFQVKNRGDESTPERKERALYMLEKLLTRHDIAEKVSNTHSHTLFFSFAPQLSRFSAFLFLCSFAPLLLLCILVHLRRQQCAADVMDVVIEASLYLCIHWWKARVLAKVDNICSKPLDALGGRPPHGLQPRLLLLRPSLELDAPHRWLADWCTRYRWFWLSFWRLARKSYALFLAR